MMRGSTTVNMDRGGRVRIASEFLKIFEEKYGNEVFITSIDGKNVLIYPLVEWEKIGAIASEKADDPLTRDAMRKINFHWF
jgi:DNA-binding transcriptional regulator/RsmH inhibitor MraZ